MAISLDRANRTRTSQRKKTEVREEARKPDRKAHRPWSGRMSDENTNFELPSDFNVRFLPEDLDAATSAALLKSIVWRYANLQWHDMKKKSYWLSRITHRNSWWMRVKLYPTLRVPMPSWFTHKLAKDCE
jgi:hypothetical protein